jgi:hypothetical protein
MALSPFFTKLSASIPSIREKLARGEHAPDRMQTASGDSGRRPTTGGRSHRFLGLREGRGTPATETSARKRKHLPSGPKADQSRYEEMLPS